MIKCINAKIDLPFITFELVFFSQESAICRTHDPSIIYQRDSRYGYSALSTCAKCVYAWNAAFVYVHLSRIADNRDGIHAASRCASEAFNSRIGRAVRENCDLQRNYAEVSIIIFHVKCGAHVCQSARHGYTPRPYRTLLIEGKRSPK